MGIPLTVAKASIIVPINPNDWSNILKINSQKLPLTVFLDKDSSGFFIEFSAPKYAKGNNVEMIYPHELSTIMARLYDELCAYMDYKLPEYSSWPVYRLDVCYNWLFMKLY